VKHFIAGKNRKVGRLLLLVALAVLCGCGRTAKITGKVTYQGRPVVYGSVIFLSADKTVRSCIIESDGSYSIEGVPTGEVKVSVASPNPSRGRSTTRRRMPVEAGRKETGSQGPAVEGWFPLPAAYELPFVVGSGHVSHDIDLK
jgi:hypothetical protein